MANTIDDLKEQALTIKNASQTGENTANRVGTLFYDIVDNLVAGKYEFRYKNSKVKPTKPADGSDGTTGGWAKEPTDPHYDEGELTWMTQCYYSYANGYGKWSTPIRITGANGKDGEDGKDVEFVYTRNNTGKTLNPPIYDDAGNPVDKTDDWTGYDQDGVFWTDNPQGVDEDHMYEYVCVRTKEAGAARWNAFSEPSIWSKWGQKGRDGDGYEYIFFTTPNENTVPNINYDTWFDPRTQTYKTKNDDEYLPYSTDGTYSTRWSDDPNGVSETSKIEWVSVRKKINSVWGDFVEPKVWSKYAKDGTSGARYEVRYKNYTPTEEAPIPVKPTGDGRSDGWTDTPIDPDIEHGECTFISQAYYQEGEEGSTGTYGEWTDPIRITGPQGLPGEDGADIEFIYTRINDLQFAPAAPEYDADHNPINIIDDWKGIDDKGVIWTDNPQGVDADDHRYEFISMRTRAKDSLVWEKFSVPALWSNWGKTGMDGDGIQYIFKLFPYELNDEERVSNIPNNATMNDSGEWMPSGTSGVNAGWYDNPPSATQSMPFCYCSIIRKIGGEWNKNGEYGKFEPLGYWTKWSKDGENAIKIDLDNEMDSILYDGTGTQKMSGNVTTNVYLYDGIEDVSAKASFSISNREGMREEQATITGRTITVNGLISDGIVTIRGEYPLNSGKYYYTKFTVKKLVGVDKYDLVVNPSAISVNTSEVIADTPITVQVYRTPANGGERGIINIDSYGLTLSVTTSAGTRLEGTGETTKTYNLIGSMSASIDYLTVLLTKATTTQDIETIPVNHVRNGKDGSGSSAVRIDLSNEMDSIPCDVDGYVMSDTTLHTNARIYDGASPVVLTADNTEITIDKIAGVDASYSFVEGALDVNWVIYNSSTVPLTQDKYTANITIEWNDNTYYATFIAAVVKSGEPGVSPTIYQLAPEPNTLAFKKTSEGKLPTSPITLNMKIKKSDGEGTGFISIEGSGLTVKYSFDDMPDTPSKGESFPVSGVPVNVSTNNVYVAAFKDTTLVDKETIPVIIDGIDGTSPWIADLDNEMDSVACDINGQPVIKSTLQTNLSMFYGSSKKKFKIVGITCNGSSTPRTGVSINYSEGFAESISVTVEYTTQATIGKDDFAITMQPEDAPAEARILHFTVNGIKPGPDGKPASTYRLVPSCSEIARKKDGSTVPSENVNCSVIKTTGNSDPEEVTSGFTLRTFVNGKEQSGSDVNPRNVTSNILYELYVGNVLVDKETIPLVTDGNDSKEPGPQGPGGWMITANPATAIITQGMGTSTSGFNPAYVSFSAKKGDVDATISDIGIPTSDEFRVSKVVKDGEKKVEVESPKLNSSSDYYTEGTFTVSVDVIDPDDNTKIVTFNNVTVPCIANLLGTWKEKIVGDTKTVVADSFKYVDGEKDEDPTGKLWTVRESYRRTATAAGNYETWSSDESTKEGSLKWMNEHINTADKNISTITKKVDNGKNLLSGVLTAAGWKSGNNPTFNNDAIVDDGDWIRVVSGDYNIKTPNITLEAGTYTFSLESNSSSSISGLICNASGGSHWGEISLSGSDRKKVTFNTASQITVYIVLAADSIRYPQIEVGSTVTDFDADTVETSSRIKQTADEIELKVGETGIDIDHKEINLTAGKVNFKTSTGSTNTKISIDPTTGTLHAVDGEFEGKITSTEGSIGGFEISNDRIGEDGDPNEDDNFTVIYNDGKAFFCNYTAYNSSFVVHGNTEITGNSIDLEGNVFLIARDTQKVYIEGQLNMDSDFSNNEVGDVYRDDFGSLFVRKESRSANFNQINVKTSSFTLPDNPPIGTIYLLKGMNFSNSMVVTTRNAPILQGSSNEILVSANSSYDFGGVGVMLFYIGGYWAMIYSN